MTSNPVISPSIVTSSPGFCASAFRASGESVGTIEPNGTLRFALNPYGSFTGGVRVATGDVNGDNLADIVTGAGAGGGPHVKAFDGRSLDLLQSFFAGDPSNADGVLVGVANLSGDNRFEIVTGLSGSVRTFGSTSATLPYIEQDNITSFSNSIMTGPAVVRQENGIIAILIGAAPKPNVPVGPHVQIIDGTSNTIVQSFFAFPPTFTGGVFVG